MAKNNQDDSMYMEVISSLASNAASNVVGVTVLGSAKSSYKEGKFRVYMNGDEVTIDVFIDIMHGFSVPDVAFAVQEAIKSEVEGATKYKVKNVNVQVSNVIFP